MDDAIVVVESVERIMSEEKLSPKEATYKAMSQNFWSINRDRFSFGCGTYSYGILKWV
ncbi:MAG: hypothetical protein R3E67_03430 [Pseudomonadales bacterium]